MFIAVILAVLIISHYSIENRRCTSNKFINTDRLVCASINVVRMHV